MSLHELPPRLTSVALNSILLLLPLLLKQLLFMIAAGLLVYSINGAILFCKGIIILISFRLQLKNSWREYDGWVRKFDVSDTEIYLKYLNFTFTFRIACLSKNDIYFHLTIIFCHTVVSPEKIKKKSKVRDFEIVRL